MVFLREVFILWIPIILTLVLAYSVNKFVKILNKRRVLREKILVINRLTDFFQKKSEQILNHRKL